MYILEQQKQYLMDMFLDKSTKTQKLYSYKKSIPHDIIEMVLKQNLISLMPHKGPESMLILKSDNKKYYQFQQCLAKYMAKEYPETTHRYCAYFLDEWFFTSMLLKQNVIKYRNENKEFIQSFIKLYFDKDDWAWKWRYKY